MPLTPAALSALAKGDFENFIAASTPGGIEAQEKAGQAELVRSAKLPKEGYLRETAEALGIVFSGDIDDLFVAVTLPTGWRLQATDHSMHSDLLDEQGRRRAGVFYKAAFYDRAAHMSLCCAIRIEQ